MEGVRVWEGGDSDWRASRPCAPLPHAPSLPSGVGLSFSEKASDYATNDTRTALDANAFLRGWFARFPHFQANQFFVSGGPQQGGAR